MNPPRGPDEKLYQEATARELRRVEDAAMMREEFKKAAEEWMEQHAAEQKKVFKDVLTDFLNEQFAQFGKFSMYGLVATGFAALVWLYFFSKGFQKP